MYKPVKYCIYLLLSAVLLISCKESSEKNEGVMTIEPSSKPAKASELFNDLRFVALESSTAGLIGLKIQRVELFQDRIYILNRMHSHANILCFDSKGNFLFKIDHIGQGPGEYTYLGDFFIDKENGLVVLVSERGHYPLFDLNGKFVSEKRTRDTYYSRQIIPINDTVCLAYNDASLPPVGYNLLYLDSRTFNILSKSDRFKEPFYDTGFHPLSVYEGNILFYTQSDSIYSVNNSKAAYYVDLGEEHEKSKRELSRKYGQKEKPHEEYIEDYTSLFKENKIKTVTSIQENDHWIVINLMTNTSKEPGQISASSKFILYDKKENVAYDSENIIFDILNIQTIENIEVVASTKDELYCVVYQTFSEDELNGIQASKISPSEKDKMMHQDVENNPVIMILKK